MPYMTLCSYPGCPSTLDGGHYCEKHRPKHADGSKYRTKRWGYTRKSVFLRDGYKCQMCGDLIGGSPQCDHIRPISQGGTDDEDNLQTLCVVCHAKKTTATG